jgi:hypothetical protein
MIALDLPRFRGSMRERFRGILILTFSREEKEQRRASGLRERLVCDSSAGWLW